MDRSNQFVRGRRQNAEAPSALVLEREAQMRRIVLVVTLWDACRTAAPPLARPESFCSAIPAADAR